ncbi:nucleic acid-binding protein [Coniochaeta sp. PMI_546]|nr:nucleic acid-binding protein [Coniochaeta sp. PMI_546]
MASLKRKEAKTEAESRPSKRTKSENPTKDEGKPKAKDDKKAASKPATAPVVSRLIAEEPLFPRGGGSVLSPLEHKQIQVQAKTDALFEEQSGTAAKKGEKALKKKRRKSDKEVDAKPVRDENAAKVESLNYKRLVKGSLVLGQVSAINPLDIALSLPNNIVGHVSITSISEALTARIQESAMNDDAASTEDADDESNDIDLNALFEIGQYVRAAVVSTTDDSAPTSGKAKRHIELSLRPELANSGLSAQDVVQNCTVMASVASVEDHGFVMDLGIADSDRGFLPKKKLDKGIPEERLQPGAVVLCLVTGKKGKITQLSTLRSDIRSIKNDPSTATTINTFLPGTVADVLITDVSARGIVGKVMGHLDVTADLVHSGAGPYGIDLEEKYKAGSRLKARIICTFPAAKNPKLGISVLPHVLSLVPKTAEVDGKPVVPLTALPNSAYVETCTVQKVEPEIGLYVDVGIEGVPGFVHISRVKDGKVDALFENSGPFKIGSTHRGRVIGYSALDGMYSLSFQKSVLEQPYLRIEDIPVGEVVTGTVEKLVVNERGLGGLIMKLADGISGLVPEMHLADVHLQHPEKKFREGMKVKARVLSTDPSKHQIRLTLKKTLVNSDAPAVKSFDELSEGLQVPGTIIKLLQNGAIVQFYGQLRGFLPVSEMSEAYIHDPKEHFRIGQVVNVHILAFEPDERRLIVSCKDPSAFGIDKQQALHNMKIGDIVSGKVTQKTEDDVFIELNNASLKALLPLSHLTDKSLSKAQSALKKIHVNQVLSELVVLDKNEGRRSITVSMKPSLLNAAKEGKFLASIEDAKVGSMAQGFVRNITPTAVFVQFGGRLCALLPKSMMPRERQQEPEFGLRKSDPLEVRIASVDKDSGRVVVAIPSPDEDDTSKVVKPKDDSMVPSNAIDESIKSADDITVGKLTKARIVSVKDTQLNVQLADNIQGRVDVSQAFDSWDEIKDHSAPLKQFKPKQIIDVRILGVHDARNHRFLPFSHRSSHSVLELSIRPSDLKEGEMPKTLTYEKLEVGGKHLAFVNNVDQKCLWVNLSTSVRGRITAVEASDDVSQLANLRESFPIGSALRVHVLAVKPEEKHLDLSARTQGAVSNPTLDTVETNMVLTGRITRVTDRLIIVNLGDTLAGTVHMIDMADDYDEANPMKFAKNEIVRVSVVEVDRPNKRLRLSTRASRVLNSSLPVKDKEITKSTNLQVGEIVRGFVKNVGDKGLFVNLGGDVTAMVWIKNTFDQYVKDWKEHFQVDQVVKGRIISTADGRINLSLKPSDVEKDFVPLIKIEDLKEGQTITGHVKKVEEYGAFIEVDGAANVSGLCHRSEMAEKHVNDARKLYKVGDRVKARVLKVDAKNKKINFGLKPSYFEDDSDSDEDMSDDSGAMLEFESEDSEGEEMQDDGAPIAIKGTDNDEDDEDDSDIEMDDAPAEGLSGGLEAGGFDWSAAVLDESNVDEDKKDAAADAPKKKKKSRTSEIQVDRTAQLDAHGPQTASDYERQLLGQPDDWQLWIAYMAFQMQVSELAKAREVAERALKTINIREDAAKLNVWIAYLNLEVAYGTDETVDEVFKRACTYNDEQTVTERLASIYIKSGKLYKADALFETLVKKFGSKTPSVWENYADYLHKVAGKTDQARALIKRATQALDERHHLPLLVRFAALEFHSPNGDPETGRTLFEGLLSSYPKRFDLWNQLLDLETSAYAKGRKEGKDVDAAAVRDVFERGTKVKALKAEKAKKWFQRWAKWEEQFGDAKSREKVSARAQLWAREAEARRKAREEAE